MFSKADYSYIADTVTKAGAMAVIIDYALMPEVRMAAIVEQVRRAKQCVLDTIASYGDDPGRIRQRSFGRRASGYIPVGKDASVVTDSCRAAIGRPLRF